MVVFNKERYLKVKSIAKSAARRLKKRKHFKNLTAKIKKVSILDRSAKSNYEYLASTYAKKAQVWSWLRLSQWHKDLKDYYD